MLRNKELVQSWNMLETITMFESELSLCQLSLTLVYLASFLENNGEITNRLKIKELLLP